MTRLAAGWFFVLTLTPLPLAQAITSGQVDTFQDGTTDNWTNGHPTIGTPPVNIGTNGPAGAGDKFLEITSNGAGGTDSRLVTFNRTQWLGNYVAAGITEIDMDLENLGSVTLSIRLAFRGATFNGAPGYLTTTAFTLAPNSGWQHANFLIDASSLTAIGGPAAFSTFFTAGPAEVRILSEAGTTSLDGDVVAAQLGVDNVIAVPEPNAGALFIAGALLVWSIRRSTHSFPPRTSFRVARIDNVRATLAPRLRH